MKKTGGEKWDFMKLDYKRRNKLIDNPELKFPNADKATADDRKFTKYLFNPENKNGYAKGVAFNSRLGYNKSNWKEFEKDVLSKAKLNPASFDRKTEHGDYYNLPMVMYGKKDNPMDLMTAWEVKGDTARLITAFPNREKE